MSNACYEVPEIIDVDANTIPEEARSKFWVIWNPNGHSPRYRHITRQSAVNEAHRLARQAPSHHFIVLEAIACYQAAPPISETILLDETGEGEQS